MFEFILLASMVLLSVLAIHAVILRMAIIFFGIFSLVCSLLYLYYQAPDVAIAEAVIGSGLITLLYLTALKRYQVYNIAFTSPNFSQVSDHTIVEGTREGQFVHDIEQFCVNRELEPQFVFTPDDPQRLLETGQYELVLSQDDEQITVYGNRENYVVDELEILLILRYEDLNVVFERVGEDADAEIPDL